MKKMIVLVVGLSLAFAASAFATDISVNANSPLLVPNDVSAAGGTLNVTAPVSGTIGKCSKGVRMSAQFNNVAYALETMHMNGSKYYGVANDSTAIYVMTPAAGTDLNIAFAAPGSSVTAGSFDGTSWSKL